jgi:hypothetical protein
MAIYRAPKVHNIPGLSRAMHVLVLGRHVHWTNHHGIVMSWGRLCWFVGIAPRVFVGLECVGYLVCCFVTLGYAKASYVWVGACGE